MKSARDRRATSLAPPEVAPHSIEAEQSVLGGLMLDDGALTVIDDLIDARSFHLAEHRIIFSAVHSMRQSGEPADPITVFEHLRNGGLDAAAGGLSYLNELQASVPSALNLRKYAEIVAQRFTDRQLIDAGREIERIAADSQSGAGQRVERMAAVLARVDKGTSATPPPFRVLPLANLNDIKIEAPAWVWQYYIPLNLLTVLSGHGGVGKSLVAMMLAVQAATGGALFGVQTARCRVAYFSGEDHADLLLHRLLWICGHLGVDPADLAGWLHLLDATEADPALFREVQVAGQRIGASTAMHADLAAYLEQHDIGLLVVDNMSDTYDASEIERAKVRAFLRSLLQLRKDRKITVLLLVHVDKGTARGDRPGSESYSGSTAVHNSARSRLFLSRDKDGALRLEHQKCNVGPMRPPLALQWPEDGLPELDAPINGYVQAAARGGAVRAMLRLVSEYSGRGEWISTSLNSAASASRLLQSEPSYPKGRRPAEVQALLRDAERDKLLARETYLGADRKPRERWSVTDTGRVLIEARTASGAGVQ